MERSTGMNRRKFNTAAAATSVLAALSPFGIARAQGAKLKVGVLLPRSGYLGFIGQSCQKGADLAPGVIKNLLGVDIELMNADTETQRRHRAHARRAPHPGRRARAGRRLRLRAADRHRAGRRAARRALRGQHRCRAADHRAGLQVRVPQLPDRARPGEERPRRSSATLFQATSVAPRSAVFMHVNDTFGQAMSKGINAFLPRLTNLPFKIIESVALRPGGQGPHGRSVEGQGRERRFPAAGVPPATTRSSCAARW